MATVKMLKSFVTDREHIKKALRRVGWRPSRVDDVHVWRHVLGNQVGSAWSLWRTTEHIGRHGAEVGNGVEQGLAFGCERPGYQVDHLCQAGAAISR
jgi:hypothetical protein